MSTVSNDPLTKFTIELAKTVSRDRIKNLVDQLDDDEDIYSDGQDIESSVSFHSDLYYTKTFLPEVQYTSPSEPDDDVSVRLWFKGDNLGSQLNDISGKNRHGTLYGNPVLVNGNPFDYGLHSGTLKSIALRFNRPTSPGVNKEYVAVPNTALIKSMNGIITGISYFIRFRIHDLSAQGGFDRTLMQKRDDTTSNPDDGIRATVTSTGRLIFRMRRGGAEIDKQTATSTIATNTVYDVWITYTISGDVVHIYVNNSDKTLTDPGTSSTWGSPTTDLDWHIFKTGGGDSDGGYLYGDLYDFMLVRNRVVSSTEVSRHYTNKWTTANIPFGQVLVPNYSASYGVLNGILLDGSNDYIQLTNDSALWSLGLTKFSFSIRVYSTAAPVTADRYIVSHGNTSNHGKRLMYRTSDGKISWNIKNAAGTNQDALSNSALPLNQWNSLMGTYDNTLGTQNIKLYINKTLQTDTGNLTETINISDELTLGTEVSANTPSIKVKDFRWWKTKALTQTEVNDIHDNAQSQPLPDYWLPMIEGANNPIDTITGTKVGTLTNGASWA